MEYMHEGENGRVAGEGAPIRMFKTAKGALEFVRERFGLGGEEAERRVLVQIFEWRDKKNRLVNLEEFKSMNMSGKTVEGYFVPNVDGGLQ